MCEKRFPSKRFLSHATQGGMSRGEQIIYDQILATSTYDKHKRIHGEQIRNDIFSKKKNSNARITQDFGEGHWGIIGV